MRRRPPHTIPLSRSERRSLRNLLADGRTEQRVARRARILLAVANPATILTDLAERFEQSRSGIWTLCRRFEQRGVDVIYDAWSLDILSSGRKNHLLVTAVCLQRGSGFGPLVPLLA
jgi:hypothetical protein